MVKKITSLNIIISVGLLFRLVFSFVIARFYFNREFYWADGDTGYWIDAFVNLVEHGIYSTGLDREYGFCGRMPAYSFLIGPLYYLFGKDVEIASIAMGVLQIFLDTVNIFLFYKILFNITDDIRTSLTGALLYAFYPFIVVWNPVAYSELPSIFFLFYGLFFLTDKSPSKLKYFFGGISMGISILMRPQLLPFTGIVGLMLLFKLYRAFNKKEEFYLLAIYSFGLLISYGTWPLRNYIFHDKIMLTQDLKGLSCWDVDIVAFREFTYSVKSEWEPQFSDLIQNKEVKFPLKNMTEEDEVKLKEAIYMSQNCCYSFSFWVGYWKEKISPSHDTCKFKVQAIFDELRMKQIERNPWDYYLFIPLQNLKKCFFKFNLYDTSTPVRKLSGLLFVYRTILIFIGLLFFISLFINSSNASYWMWVFVFYFLFLYITLSFGTSSQMRNIEMRYLLPADIILLFPAAGLISKWIPARFFPA